MNLPARRKFLQFGLLSSAVFVMQGCTLFGITTMRATIETLQEDLFEHSHSLGTHTTHYFYTAVLGHSRINEDEKEFLRNGVIKINELSSKEYKLLYTKLSRDQREVLLRTIVKSDWGASWVQKILGYILEATLSDPVYEGNLKEHGWKWLAYKPAQPQPKEAYL